MKHFGKVLTLMVVCLLVLGLFAACTPARDEPETPEEAVDDSEETTETTDTDDAATLERTWETDKGTFVLADRIVQKVINGESLDFVVSSWDPGTTWFAEVGIGGAQAAADLGNATCKDIGPTDAVFEKQVTELETLIQAEQVDGIVVTCKDADVMIPIFDLAWEKGIPVVTYDGDSPESKRLTFCGINHLQVGAAGGEAIAKNHPDKDVKLAIFAADSTGVYARGRVEGMLNVLNEKGYNITQLGPFDLTVDKSKGYGVVENAFLANPDIQVVYVPDEFVEVVGEYMTRNDKTTDDVVVVGVNDLPEVVQYIETGQINETCGINPYGQGYAAVTVLHDFIMNGNTSDEMVKVDLTIVNVDNVDEWLANNM